MTQYYRTTGGAAALAVARRVFTGLPYKFGGVAPGPTDCSGVWEYSYAQVGVTIDRTTYDQYKEDPLNDRSIPSEPGDLLFIPGSDAIGVMPGHVVGYMAPGVVFEAEETGTKIGVFSFNTNAWEYRTRPSLMLPPAPPKAPPLPAPKGLPTPADLRKATLVAMKNVAEAELAIKNGWHLWYWASTHFVAQVGAKPSGVTLYANQAYRTKAKAA